MEFTSPRATLEEVKQFCNIVREAGGANPIDALMPSIPNDPHTCLIARNLNFSCQVNGAATTAEQAIKDYEQYIDGSGEAELGLTYTWIMRVEDEEVRAKIAEALGLELVVPYDAHHSQSDGLYAFQDEFGEPVIMLPNEIGEVAYAFDHYGNTPELWDEFAPYIEESVRRSKEELFGVQFSERR